MRAVALIVSLVALCLAIVVYSYARKRQAALDYVESTGGHVVFLSPPRWWPDALPIPNWLQSVRLVHIGENSCDLSRILVLHELTEFAFSETDFTDEDLAYVGRFRNLSWLSTEKTEITDHGLLNLRDCNRLETLWVESPRIGDEGLKSLAHLPISTLSFRSTRVTDAGLEAVRRMPLKSLMIGGTQVTDAGLKHLAGLDLEELELWNTSVTDAGLRELTGLPLEYLDLRNTRVTYSGLKQLKAMQPLSCVVLYAHQLTEEELTALRNAGVPVTVNRHPAADK